jgi:hypothetical protein
MRSFFSSLLLLWCAVVIRPWSSRTRYGMNDDDSERDYPVALVSVCPRRRSVGLALGDTVVTSSSSNHSADNPRVLRLFLPAVAVATGAGEVFCTFNVSCDGSVVLRKEHGSPQCIWVNGHVVVPDKECLIKARDVVVLGSLEYAYEVAMSGYSSDDSSLGSSRGTRPVETTVEDVATSVLLAGDLDCRIEDFHSGELLSLGNNYNLTLINIIRSISVFAFQAHEMMEWLRWLGLAAHHILRVDVAHQCIDLQVRLPMCHS